MKQLTPFQGFKLRNETLAVTPMDARCVDIIFCWSGRTDIGLYCVSKKFMLVISAITFSTVNQYYSNTCNIWQKHRLADKVWNKLTHGNFVDTHFSLNFIR